MYVVYMVLFMLFALYIIFQSFISVEHLISYKVFVSTVVVNSNVSRRKLVNWQFTTRLHRATSC